MILCLAVLVQYRYRLVTDGQTDGRTHGDSIYRASIASCGKNGKNVECKWILITIIANTSCIVTREI